MAELIVVGFHGTRRAAEVLEQLQFLESIQAVDLKDAIAVYRTDDGKLRFDESVQPTTKEEAALGGVLGALVGAVLVAPLAAIAAAPAAAAAVGIGGTLIGATGGGVVGYDNASLRAAYNISEDFVKQVGGMVQPGESALFALVRASNPDAIAEQFRGYGGKILRTTLDPVQTRRLQETLAASP